MRSRALHVLFASSPPAIALATIVAACGSSSDRPGPGSNAVDAGPGGSPAVGPDSGSDAADVDDAPLGAALLLSVDTRQPGRELSTALLGHYDLAGALWHYDQVPGLVQAMQAVGLPEWRLSIERWEGRSEMFPTLTDGSACSYPEPSAFVPAGDTDRDLLRARDWFVDDGQPVTQSDTVDDGRYALGYARSVIDVARAFGAAPFVSIDAMPAAFSQGKSAVRTNCYYSFANRVSNVAPADPKVFGAAIVGLVKRLVDGSAGEPGRPVTHFEIWNEPDGSTFWDATFDPNGSQYVLMAKEAIDQLGAFRASSAHGELRFGLGGFAGVDAAVAAIARFDTLGVPLDFVSFHAYETDPIVLSQAIARVVAAAKGSVHYRDAEIVLSEWGPGPDIEHNDESRTNPDLAYAASIAPALHAATVIARGANLGLSRAHHVFFWDFFSFRIRGLLDHELRPRPQYWAFQLLSAVITQGARWVSVAGDSDTDVVLAAQDARGQTHVLLVHRSAADQDVRVSLAGALALPTRVRALDDPAGPPHELAVRGATVHAPAQSIVLMDF